MYLSLYIYIYVYVYIYIYIKLIVIEIAVVVEVVDISLRSVQKQPKTTSDLSQRGAEYGKCRL